MSNQNETDENDNPPTRQERIYVALFALVLLALGVAMIVWPDALVDSDVHPRKLFLKVIAWIWGRPGGIVIALLGLLFGWHALKSPAKTTGEK